MFAIAYPRCRPELQNSPLAILNKLLNVVLILHVGSGTQLVNLIVGAGFDPPYTKILGFSPICDNTGWNAVVPK